MESHIHTSVSLSSEMCTEINHFANVKLSIGIDVLDRPLDVPLALRLWWTLCKGLRSPDQ